MAATGRDAMAFGLFGRKKHERAGYELYTAAVQAARDPYYYNGLGVPDTIDGRFDMVGLHVFLLINRLHSESDAGAKLAQAVFDAMFSDMDFTLREIGVGDMTVGKKVKAMWEAFHGRANAYAAALQANDGPALAAAVARNVWRGAEPDANAVALAEAAMRQSRHLASQPLEALLAGRVSFEPPVPLAA